MIKGFNHIGISVVNLDRSIEFYSRALGVEVLSRGSFQKGYYDGRYEQILGLPGATGRSSILRVGNLKLELFEFSHPAPNPMDANYPVCDHGISHFCVEVTEIHVEYERLKAMGVVFHCPPLEFGGKVLAAYARDPDGNVFELLQTNEV